MNRPTQAYGQELIAKTTRKCQQVAQGQYVVSDTHCPALIVNWSEREQGSGPKGDEVL